MKQNPNSLCYCGSSKKFKKCCGKPGAIAKTLRGTIDPITPQAQSELDAGDQYLLKRALVKAHNHYKNALKISPDSIRVLHKYCGFCLDVKDYAAALEFARICVNHTPNDDSYRLLSFALYRNNEVIKAKKILETLVKKYPDNPTATAYLAFCHSDLANYDRAINLLFHSLKSDGEGSKSSGRYRSLHTLLIGVERFSEASQLADTMPSHIEEEEVLDIRYGECLSQLKQKQFDLGFENFRLRWDAPAFPNERHSFLPEWKEVWDGQTCSTKILLVDEQGVGDRLLFSSLIDRLLEYHSHVTYVCENRIAGFLERRYKGLNVIGVDDRTKISDVLAKIPDYSMQIFVGDLSAYLNLSSEEIQSTRVSFKPKEDLYVHFRNKYEDMFPGKFLVGVSWNSKRATWGEHKSIHLTDLEPLINFEKVQAICLQYGDVKNDLDEMKKLGINVYHDPEVEQLTDLENFAAQVSCMDHIITISNTTAHFAGAFNIPNWTLVRRRIGTLWYWGTSNISTCSWYPSTRLIWNKDSYSWQDVIKRLTKDTRRLLNKKGVI